MTYNFCTLFDKNFLLRGLALYESCVTHCGDDFTLWILCMDEESKTLLEKLALPHVKLLTLDDLNDPELMAVRSERNASEFSWTSKSVLMNYLMKDSIPAGEGLAWLDSDQFLFASPHGLYEHMKNSSIVIVPHRFSPPNPGKESMVGIYNAGWIFIRNDANGRQCLTEWRAQCIEWCYDRKEDGKFGDQPYLNAWPQKYAGVMSLDWIGVNAGPWNLPGKKVRKEGENIYLDGESLIFYHFHGLRLYLSRSGKLRWYPVSIINNTIYPPHLRSLERCLARIRSIDPSFTFRAYPPLGFLRRIKQELVRAVS